MNKGQILNGSAFSSLKVELVKHNAMKAQGEMEI
jgi:hypothetical protein